MPEIAEPGRRAAGLVTSLAPITSATSVRENSGLLRSQLTVFPVSRPLRLGTQRLSGRFGEYSILLTS